MTDVDVLELGEVMLPDWHPRAADGTCVIRGFAIRHPDGVILFDTGVAGDHEWVNDMFRPTVVPIVEAVNGAGIDERDVVGIVNSHLHFDHCGQNRFLPEVPVYAQQAELDAVEQPRFTIQEWARIDPGRVRLVDGDEEIASGVHVLSTPGHTPGHQSMLIEHGGGGPTLLAGQCCYTCAEFAAGEVAPKDVHDESFMTTALESLARLRSLHPSVTHLAHDRQPYVAS